MGNRPTSGAGVAEDLHRYLQHSRDNLVRSLDEASEYDVRRPMTPTGTNLLGLVKHLIGIELGYLGDSVGRPAPVVLPWYADGSVWDNGDMWAKPEESRDQLVELYRLAWRHSDESIRTLPLDAPAEVAWWPEERRRTSFGHLVVRVTSETAQHAGHADVVRELIDGRSGSSNDELGPDWWAGYLARVQAAADTFAPRTDDRERT